MPALVKSNVGSLAGNKGEERTRECPYRSKYCKKLSRISLPFMTNSSLSRVLEASESDEKQETIHEIQGSARRGPCNSRAVLDRYSSSSVAARETARTFSLTSSNAKP